LTHGVRGKPPYGQAAALFASVALALSAGAQGTSARSSSIGGGRGTRPIRERAQRVSTATAATSFVAGFGADTPARVAKAAEVGITADILYEGPPAPSSPLGQALTDAHLEVIDARISGVLFDWECHRTHTVAPPPHGQRNTYCAKDQEPSVDSPAVVLSVVEGYLREDASNPLVSGYWVLDDWPAWDGGSGRELLGEVREEIEEVTPGYPAICGFGGSIEAIGEPGGFAPPTALNYSPGGCSMVGLYNYTGSISKRSNGRRFEWSMKLLLKEEDEDLSNAGWKEAEAPLLGIGQAWSGPFEKREYEPGLSPAQMLAESEAFCAAGASALGWYAWDDSGFGDRTKTPNNASAIRRGIEESIAACPAVAELDWPNTP
jgi:hypothetical protein